MVANDWKLLIYFFFKCDQYLCSSLKTYSVLLIFNSCSLFETNFLNHRDRSKSSFQGSLIQIHHFLSSFNLDSIHYPLLQNIIYIFHFYGSSLRHLNRFFKVNFIAGNLDLEFLKR